MTLGGVLGEILFEIQADLGQGNHYEGLMNKVPDALKSTSPKTKLPDPRPEKG